MGNSILEIPPISKIRRVHGLEHATIHILSRRVTNVSFSGLSIPQGFWLVGTVEPDEVAYAANEALRRLKGGEASLAVHARCGTNLAVGGLLTGVMGFMAGYAFDPEEHWLERLPRVVIAATIAMIFAGPAGFAVQENITTSPDAARLSLGGIRRINPSLYFVEVHSA